jgi:hypothetical protein
MTWEFSCARPRRDTNVQCVCLFLMMETTANSALIKIAVVIVGLDPAIHLFRKKMDARVNPRIKSGDAHDGGEQRLNSSRLRCSEGASGGHSFSGVS